MTQSPTSKPDAKLTTRQAQIQDGLGLHDEDQRLSEIALHARSIIEAIGEDPGRGGLLKTPERVAKAQLFLTEGYQQDPIGLLKSAIFIEDYHEVILVKDIEFFSMCEHHMLPFHGRVHIAYLPDGKIVGLSKIPRAVNALARRLQVQERLTSQLSQALNEALAPRGVAVAIEASHMCMMMRGVQKQGATTLTVSTTGTFEQVEQRAEFLSLIRS